MFPLRDLFPVGAPASVVPRDWFQTVSRIFNSIRGVNCRIKKTANPSEENPWEIIVDDGNPETGEPWTTGDLYKVKIILPDPTLGVPRPQWDYPRAHP